jgi:hypothetical protein
MRLFLILIFMISSALSKGQSIEWQKIELEELITSKYSRALSGVLDRDEFLVKTEVKYSNPGMPNFKDLNKDQYKVSDIEFDESKGDYIAFSKVGLEVPVVGKAYKENQNRLKELYRFNESYNLFKNIEEINVKVVVSKIISESKIKVVNNITKNLDVNIAGFTPKVEVVKEDIALAIREDRNGGIGASEVLAFIGKFGNAIGLILAVLLFGFLLQKSLKMYMEFMERLKANEQPAPEAQEEKDDKSDSPGMPMPGMPDAESGKPASFKSFLQLLEMNQEQCAILVKRWLKSEDDNAKLALTGIAQQLETKDLATLFKHLNTEEKEMWNSSLKGYLDSDDLLKANKLITEGVVKEIVGGSTVSDFEVIELILSMNFTSIKEFILKGDKNSSILANIVNPDVLAKLLSDLDVQTMEGVIANSMKFNYQDLDNLDGFKAELQKFASVSKASPFNSKLITVIKDISPEKETTLYKYLVKGNSIGEITNIAIDKFPSDLMLQLPEDFLKSCMQAYPMQNKIKLLASLAEDQRNNLMNTFLEEGSSGKEMIMMELETIQGDELEQKRIEKDSEKIWSEFLDFGRKKLAVNKNHREEAQQILENWLVTMKDGNTQPSEAKAA